MDIPDAEPIAALRDIVNQLRADTGASRTTIRVDCPALGLEMASVAAESLDDGARSLKGQRTPNVHGSAAVRWLRANKRTFVMEDCLNPWNPEVAPEDYVIELYGIRSEMVSGVFQGEALIGVVSVHYTKGVRTWSDEEVGMIEAACRAVRDIIDDVENG